MDAFGSEPVASLHDYVVVVRRRARLAATVFVLGVVASLVAATAIGGRSARYDATAEVLLVPASPLRAATGSRPDVQLNTERDLVKSSMVADRAAQALHTSDARSIAKDLTVTLGKDTQVLEIEATSSSPQRAEQIASAFANAYVSVRGDELVAQRDERIKQIETQIAAAEKDLSDAVAALAQASATPLGSSTRTPSAADVAARADAQARQQLAVASITAFNQQLADATTTSVDPGRLVSQPRAEPAPRTGTTPVIAVIGILLSAVAAIAAALVSDRVDWRIRGGADLEAFSGVPTIGEIPRHATGALLVESDPSGPAADAYRRLRSNLRFLLAGGDRGRVVLVTSATEGDGKTVVTANLATMLARAGLRVTVVSADLRRPRLDAIFGADAADGLSAVLAGHVSVSEVAREVGAGEVGAVRMVPAGDPAGEPADLLQSPRMGEVIAELRHRADIVLVDSPPALVVADALAIAPLADGVIAVANARRTGRDDAVALRQELDRVGGHLIGFVLTRVRPRRRVASYYYAKNTTPSRRAPSTDLRRPSDPTQAIEPVSTSANANGNGNSNGNGSAIAPDAVVTAAQSEWSFGDWVASTVSSDD
jgi:capsular exopolysaccharide synthesis family protein